MNVFLVSCYIYFWVCQEYLLLNQLQSVDELCMLELWWRSVGDVDPNTNQCLLEYKKIFCFNNQFSISYTFPSIVVLSCSVYASDVNMITLYPLVVVSVLLKAKYIPDSTNEAILSIIPSKTTWCISSNAPEGVDLCENWVMFQFLNDPRTGQ